MKSIRYVIVGTGMMGHEHLRNLALLRNNGVVDARVVALVDPDTTMRSSALALARELGNENVLALEHHAALDPDTFDALVLVSPNHTHAALLNDLLPLDRAILAEKPFCSTVADCEALLPRVARHPAPFWVAMEYRYMPPTARFLERMAEGVVGQLRMLTIREHRYPFLEKVGHWNRFSAKTGGTLVEKCCHHFDLMRLITGSEATRVYASGGQDVNHLDECYDGETPDILDNAFVIVDFANGVRALLELCMFAEGAEPQEWLTAIGDQGKLDACIPGPDRFWKNAGERHATLTLRPRSQADVQHEVVAIDPRLAAAGDHHGSTYFLHEQFARSVLHGEPAAINVADGAAAVRIGAAAQESLRTGRSVDMPSNDRQSVDMQAFAAGIVSASNPTNETQINE